MPLVSLEGWTVGMLADGTAGRMIDAAVQAIARDLDDRGDDGQPRKLVVTLEFKKEPKSSLVMMIPEVEAKVPKYRGPATQGKLCLTPRGKVNVEFRTDSDRHDQPTIDDLMTGKDGDQ